MDLRPDLSAGDRFGPIRMAVNLSHKRRYWNCCFYGIHSKIGALESMTRPRVRACVAFAVFLFAGLAPIGASSPLGHAGPGLAPPVAAAPVPALLDILQSELNRNVGVLKSQPVPPYYVSYAVYDTKSSQLDASFGAVVADVDDHARTFDVDVQDRRLRPRQHARNPRRARAAGGARARRHPAHRFGPGHRRRGVAGHRPGVSPVGRAARAREDQPGRQGQGRGPRPGLLPRGSAGLRRPAGDVPDRQGGVAGPAAPGLRRLCRRSAHPRKETPRSASMPPRATW